MCIIACSPANTPLPKAEYIRNMFEGNPDGAGFMYADNGVVRIEKGLMSLDEFNAALERVQKTVDLTKTGVVMHFRITTHGGTIPENTHPFPVSDSIGVLKKLRSSTKLGIAHNGIIPIAPRSKDISDTMEYVASQLAPLTRALPNWYTNTDALLLVKNAINSKMALLTGDGIIRTIGDFNEDEGVLYSNYSWVGWGKYRNVYNFGAWGDWGDDFYDSTYALPGKSGDSKARPIQVVARALMAVSDVRGAYLYDTESGQMFDDDSLEFYIDADREVYFYDWEADLAVPTPSIIALNESGGSLEYNHKLAVELYCDVSGEYPC